MTMTKSIRSAALGTLSVMIVLFMSVRPVYAQEKSWTPRLTPWGHPDLQGIWTNDAENLTPLQRPTCEKPDGYTGERPHDCNRPVTQQLVTDAEYQDRMKVFDNRVAIEEGNADASVLPAGADRPRVGGVGAHIWHETTPSKPSRRTSMVVDPPDGRIPPYSAEGQRRIDAEAAESLRALRAGGGATASATFWASKMNSSWFNAADIGLQSRCLSKSLPTAWIPHAYGNNRHFLQTPDSVVIVYEMYHEVRIIPLDARPHLPSAIREWMGNSRGRWEGNTLVVETTNFRERVILDGDEPPVSEDYRVIERFTRTSENTLLHETTIIDPQTWSKPITLRLENYKDDAQTQILEYACHEGNYDVLKGLIGGLRVLDAQANSVAKPIPATSEPRP